MRRRDCQPSACHCPTRSGNPEISSACYLDHPVKPDDDPRPPSEGDDSGFPLPLSLCGTNVRLLCSARNDNRVSVAMTTGRPSSDNLPYKYIGRVGVLTSICGYGIVQFANLIRLKAWHIYY